MFTDVSRFSIILIPLSYLNLSKILSKLKVLQLCKTYYLEKLDQIMKY